VLSAVAVLLRHQQGICLIKKSTTNFLCGNWLNVVSGKWCFNWLCVCICCTIQWKMTDWIDVMHTTSGSMHSSWYKLVALCTPGGTSQKWRWWWRWRWRYYIVAAQQHLCMLCGLKIKRQRDVYLLPVACVSVECIFLLVYLLQHLVH